MLQFTIPAALTLAIQPRASAALPSAVASIQLAASGTLHLALAITAQEGQSTSTAAPTTSSASTPGAASTSAANGTAANATTTTTPSTSSTTPTTPLPMGPQFRLRVAAPRLVLSDSETQAAADADFVDSSGAVFAGVSATASVSLAGAQLAWPVPRQLQDGLASDAAVALATDQLAAAAAGGLAASGSLALLLEPVEWTLAEFAHVGVPSAALATTLSDAATQAPALEVAGQLPSAAAAGFQALLSRLLATSLVLPEPPQRSGLPMLDSFSPQAVFNELAAAINASLLLADDTASGWAQAVCAPRALLGVNVTFPTCSFALNMAGMLSFNLALRLEQTAAVDDLLRRLLVPVIAGAASTGIVPADTAATAEDALAGLALPDSSSLQRLDLDVTLALNLAAGDATSAGRATFTLNRLALATRVSVQGVSATLGPLRFEDLSLAFSASAIVQPTTEDTTVAVAQRSTSLRLLNSRLATSLVELMLAQQATFAGRARLAARISPAVDGLAVDLPDVAALVTYTDNALFDGAAGAVSADLSLDLSTLESLLAKPADYLAQLIRDSGVGGAYGLPGVLDGIAALITLPVADIAAEFNAFGSLALNGSTGSGLSALDAAFGVAGSGGSAADSGEAQLLAALARLLSAADVSSFEGGVLLSSPLRLVGADGSVLLWEAGLGQAVAAALSLTDGASATCLGGPRSDASATAELRCLLQAALPPLPGVAAVLGYAWQRLRAGVEGLLGAGASSFADLAGGALGAAAPNLAGVSLGASASGPLGSGSIGLGDAALTYDSGSGEVAVVLRVAGRMSGDAVAAALSVVDLASGATADLLTEAGSSEFVGTSLDPNGGGALGAPASLGIPGAPTVVLTSTVDFTLRVGVQLKNGLAGLVPTVSLQRFEGTLALDVELTEPLSASLGGAGVAVELDDVSLTASGGLSYNGNSTGGLGNATKYASVDAEATLRLTGGGTQDIPEVLMTLADDDLLDSAPPLLTLDLILDTGVFDIILEALDAVENVNDFIFDNDELTRELPILKTRLIDLLNLEPAETEPNVVLPDVEGAESVPPAPPPPPPSSGLPALLALATPARAYNASCGSSCTARGLARALRDHVVASINSTVVPARPGRSPVCLLSGLTDTE